MKEIHELNFGGEPFYPATISDAVVHRETRKSVSSLINSYNLDEIWPKSEGSYSLTEAITKLGNTLNDSQKIKGVHACFSENNELKDWVYFGGGFDFTDSKGWREVDSGIILELQEAVFPLTLNLNTSTSLIQVGKETNVTYSWSVFRKGINVTSASSTYFDGEAITGSSKTLKISPTTNGSISHTVTSSYQGLTKTVTKTITASYLSYYGIVTGITNPDLSKYTSTLVGSKSCTVSGINLTNQRCVYAYPKYMGALSSIKDANNFEYINSYTRAEMTYNGVVYYVYLLTDPVTITNFKQVYG